MVDGFADELMETKLLELRDSVVSSTKGSRRMLLKSLLRLFGYKTRTQDRITALSRGLEQLGISASPALEECSRDEWVTLALVEGLASPAPADADPWFSMIATKQFASEKEVEIRFILPLLERLGYEEADRVDGCSIEMTIGSRKARGEADFVLFDGLNRSRDNTLMVVEAKRSGVRLDPHIDQARSYSMFLGCPYYLVTNGDDLRVFRFKSALENDEEVFRGNRSNLKSEFSRLEQTISKPCIAEVRRKLRNDQGYIGSII